jgi:hypothetical protein
MIELVTSVATAVTNGVSGMLVRSGKLLLKSALTWLLVVSMDLGMRPGQAVQVAVTWSGLPWSVEPITNWLHDRSTAAEAVAVLVAFMAISGVRFGSVGWQYTHGPFGLSVGLLLVLECGTPRLLLIGALSAGPVFAMVRERRLGSGLVVLLAPLIYLLAPLSVLADLLGFRDAQSPVGGAQGASMTGARTAQASAAALPGPDRDPDRIHPQTIRTYRTPATGEPRVASWLSGPARTSTRGQSRKDNEGLSLLDKDICLQAPRPTDRPAPRATRSAL